MVLIEIRIGCNSVSKWIRRRHESSKEELVSSIFLPFSGLIRIGSCGSHREELDVKGLDIVVHSLLTGFFGRTNYILKILESLS